MKFSTDIPGPRKSSTDFGDAVALPVESPLEQFLNTVGWIATCSAHIHVPLRINYNPFGDYPASPSFNLSHGLWLMTHQPQQHFS